MEVVYSQNRLKLEWKILRATSNNAEDFSRATVYAFAVSCTDVIPLPMVSVERGVITLEVPMGLRPDVYAVKAIWWKQGENKHAFHPFYDFGRHGARVPDIHGGSAGMAMAFRDNLFTITNIMSEATVPTVGATMSFKSHVETYGYDGLSAYEIAVIREMTTVSESEWISNLVELNNLMRNKLVDMQSQIDAKLADVSDALKEQHVILSASEYASLVSQGKVDDKVLYGIKDGEKISNLYFGKLPYIGSENVYIANTSNGAWELGVSVSAIECSSVENQVTLIGEAKRTVVYTFSNGAISSKEEKGTVSWSTNIGSVSGNILTIPANNTGSSRQIIVTASVGVGSEKVTTPVTITQNGTTALTITSATSKSVGAAGGEVTFNYTTTGNAGQVSVLCTELNSGTTATAIGGVISIIVPENESTTKTRTFNFVVRAANCADVNIKITQSKAEPQITYYVGKLGSSNVGEPYNISNFANVSESDLVSNATTVNTKIIDIEATKWLVYVMLPQEAEFVKLYYNSGIPQTIFADDDNLVKRTVTIDGDDYSVYAYNGGPGITYELTVNFLV